jgi:aminopeptidase N
MKKFFSTVIAALIFTLSQAQSVKDWKTYYRSTPEKHLNIVHTKVQVSFDYTQSRMAGKAWLTLSPHFYATDMALLDAKGMLIHEVALVTGNQKKALAYTYEDSMVLRIKLDRQYVRGEKLVVYVDYTARPNELKLKGSKAINSAKGLYFINPDGKDSSKPIQIWTQGETEATSVWCPTVDKPNQKTTQEISMTVPDKYVTLSNGLMVKQEKNKNGTRTDTWKMDLPHAPYLMFMGVGDYAVVKDSYKNIPVEYYVDKEYATVARQIFGLTPEMMGFYSKLLGVEYPWAKYAQMVAQDYVSGAMENTTATLHGHWAQQNARELTDGNIWEETIAHELFHHWFGDLVTCESFSNLAVNESFADYSEYLWMEYKYGRDAADEHHLEAMQGYLGNPMEKTKHLVRFYYFDKEDMFDLVSYQKGGRILHMLRNEVGDSAFFKGLQLYLNQNRFKAAEAHHLRMALEEVSGRDLNPFFNQWFFNNGHPEVSISYGNKNGRDFIAFEQTQKDGDFVLPIKIAAYSASEAPVFHHIELKNKLDTFYFENNTGKTIFYEADAHRILLWEKTETKTAEAWQAQYRRMGNYISRYEAITGQLALDTLGENTRQMMLSALKDPYYSIRARALRYFRQYAAQLKSEQDWALIEQLAKSEKDRPTRSVAIDVLAKKAGSEHVNLFKQATTDSSYSVAGAGLEALMQKDLAAAAALSDELNKDAEGRLQSSLDILTFAGRPASAYDSVIADFKKLPGMERLGAYKGLVYYAQKLDDPVAFKNVLAPVIDLYRRIPTGVGTYKSEMLEAMQDLLRLKEKQLAADTDNANLSEQVTWLKNQLKS